MDGVDSTQESAERKDENPAENIPNEEKECTIFIKHHHEIKSGHLDLTLIKEPVCAQGGHKIYNGRNLEDTCKLFNRLEPVQGVLTDGWEETYLAKYESRVQ